MDVTDPGEDSTYYTSVRRVGEGISHSSTVLVDMLLSLIANIGLE